MKYLAIDTSGKNLIVIAKNGDKEEIFFDPDCGLNHSVTLMDAVEQTAKKIELDLSSVDFFSCTLGAGSFTGIRIGVSTIKALCFAYKKPCLPLTTFDAIAYNRQGEKVLSLIDAKHNHFYAAAYDKNQTVIEPSYISLDDVLELEKDYKLLSFTEINGLSVEVVSLASGIKNFIEQNANSVSFDLECLSPVYVRKSQAEEGR